MLERERLLTSFFSKGLVTNYGEGGGGGGYKTGRGACEVYPTKKRGGG